MSNETQKETPTITVFRKYRNGDIIAIFPFEISNMSYYYCLSYEAIGQHGTADPVHIIRQTKPATESEYASLKLELERIGYVVETRKRITADAIESRRKQLNKIAKS